MGGVEELRGIPKSFWDFLFGRGKEAFSCRLLMTISLLRAYTPAILWRYDRQPVK